MLRRHLKSGGAPVAACAGFDFDVAGAYLEDALGGSQRADFESHLAGCAACRRHLIELSRLAQAVPHESATAAVQTPAWTQAGIRWREEIAGWFDLSGWNLKWQMVGVGGAAFAVLIAAIGVQLWRQESRRADIAASAPVSPAMQSDQGQAPQSPAPEPSPQDAQPLDAGNLVAVQRESTRASVPQPPPTVGPKDGEASVASAPLGELSKMNSPQPSGALQFSFSARQQTPIETQRNSAEAQQTPASQSSAPVAPGLGGVGRQVMAELREDPREQALTSPIQAERNEASNDITARMTPPPGINPMNSEPKPAPARGKAQAEKPPSRLSAFSRSLLPVSRSESGGKKKLEPLDDESFKPMTVRIRDKVFRFEGNMWIDQAYKPEMQWRVSTLKRGSKQYEQVLSEEPLLKEFFDRGPIILLWKDKIYRVR